MDIYYDTLKSIKNNNLKKEEKEKMFYMIYKPLQEKLITALSRITDDWENKKN
jgi:hypothetical protein